MDREEILEKSRKEGKDEGLSFLNDKSNAWGSYGFLIAIIILFIIDRFLPQKNLSDILMILLLFGVGFHSFGYWRHSKRYAFLILGILELILGIFFVIDYIIILMG